MATLPPWLQPQDVVGAYLGGAARGDASRRTALAERSQASEEQQAQQSIGLQRERIGAANRAQELDLAGIALRSQAQQQAAQEKLDFARAIREQKAAEAAVRFQGASEFSRLVADGMSTDKALLQAGQRMFYNKPDALIGALQKEEQQSALKLFREEEQRRKLDDQIAKLNMAAQRSTTEAEKLLLTGQLRDIQSENTRLREGELGRKAKADEAKDKNAYVKALAVESIDPLDALENWKRRETGGDELSLEELKDRSKSRAALSTLETFKRAGKQKAVVSVGANNEVIIGQPSLLPFTSKVEPIDTLISRFRENIGGGTESKPKRVRVRNKKTNKPGWWEGDEPIDESLYELIKE